MKGKVDFFHDMKKYGFIIPEEGGEDRFFHISEVEGDSIAEGDEVEFEAAEGDQGPKAVDVKKLEDTE